MTTTDETVVQTKVEPVDQTAVQPAVQCEEKEEPPPQVDWSDLFLVVLLAAGTGILFLACLVVISTKKSEMIWAMCVGGFAVALLWALSAFGSDLLGTVNYNLRRKRQS